MSFKINLDNVEPWGGGVILRTGTHPVRVCEEEIDESGDHPVVKVKLEAIAGEEKGGGISDWIHVTDNTLGRIAQIYKAFQVEVPVGDFDWIPLLGRTAKALVREAPSRKDPTRKFSEVASYSVLSDDEAAVARVADAFDATPVDDDDKDIPF